MNLMDTKCLDITKLHEEINQLRNQQFLICSFALLAVSTTVPHVSTKSYVSQIVVSVLIVLMIWFYVLIRTSSRLSEYLIYMGYSDWESHYEKYVLEYGYAGQRKTGILFFLSLILLECIYGFLVSVPNLEILIGLGIFGVLIFACIVRDNHYKLMSKKYNGFWRSLELKGREESRNCSNDKDVFYKEIAFWQTCTFAVIIVLFLFFIFVYNTR